MSTIPYILIAVTFAVSGQMFVKLGLKSLGNIGLSRGLVIFYIKIFSSPLVIFGSLLYTFSIFFWLYALMRVDLSFAYPFLALSYVLIILVSWLILGESIPVMRWVGVVVVCVGVLLVGSSL